MLIIPESNPRQQPPPPTPVDASDKRMKFSLLLVNKWRLPFIGTQLIKKLFLKTTHTYLHLYVIEITDVI